MAKDKDEQTGDDLPQLTDKQQEFVRLLLEGKTATDAYKGSHSAEKMADSTIWSAASRLKNSCKVRAWLAAARHAHLDKAKYTHEDYVSDLLADIEEAKASGNMGAAATFRGLLGKANAFLTDKVVRKTEKADIKDSLKQIEQVNPELAAVMAKKLGLEKHIHKGSDSVN